MKQFVVYILIFVACPLVSCKKFLDKLPDKKLAIPTSLVDFQKLLENSNITDRTTPALGDLGCDDYYLRDSVYQLQVSLIRNLYSWASDILEGSEPSDWSSPYSNIYICNVILEGLNDFKVEDPSDQAIWNNLYGSALFIRAFSHYALEETFGQPYRPNTANSDLGIPLKLKSDLASKAIRSTVQTVYDQVIKDLLSAKNLLPNTSTPINKPSQAATFALLARVYLSMQDYSKARNYADSALRLKGTLYDFNNLSDAQVKSTNPFSQFSSPSDFLELYYPAVEVTYSLLFSSTTNIDTTLFNSYDSNDLRKTVFFHNNTSTNTFYFKGKYSGSIGRFCSSPAVDEMYLTRAECHARIGSKDSALNDLNAVLIKRWKLNKFTPVSATDNEDALRKILAERRKELVFRGIRWGDLRRLNQDVRFAVTLKRILFGQTYTLAPGDKKYTYPIPNSEIQLSNIPQNPR